MNKKRVWAEAVGVGMTLLISMEEGILVEGNGVTDDLRAMAAAVEDKVVRRRELRVAEPKAEVRQRAALHAACLCKGIIGS